MIKKTSNNIFCTLMMLFMSVSLHVYAKDDVKKQEALSEDAIENQYESRKKVCEQKSENIQDICLVEAEGKRDVALAKLKADLEPTLENEVDYRVALAETKYTLSVKKCQTSKARSDCMNKAQILRDKETEDARAFRR